MPTVESRAGNPLTTDDLAPLRRMLGAHSMVIRVNADGSLLPFEIMPELFLGRPIRQLLSGPVRDAFEDACREAVATVTPASFVPFDGAGSDEIMITPVTDPAGNRVRMLVCWARHGDEPVPAPVTGLRWDDLSLDAVEIRYRVAEHDLIEAAPWWPVSDDGIALWDHDHQVASVGLAGAITSELVTNAVAAIAPHDTTSVRIGVPAADMLAGLVPSIHGAVRVSGIDPHRVVFAVPVDLACDRDLLPIIVHLRTMGVQVDIVGLDELTATLHNVSDTSDHRHHIPTPKCETGEWTADPETAIRDAQQN